MYNNLSKPFYFLWIVESLEQGVTTILPHLYRKLSRQLYRRFILLFYPFCLNVKKENFYYYQNKLGLLMTLLRQTLTPHSTVFSPLSLLRMKQKHLFIRIYAPNSWECHHCFSSEVLFSIMKRFVFINVWGTFYISRLLIYSISLKNNFQNRKSYSEIRFHLM